MAMYILEHKTNHPEMRAGMEGKQFEDLEAAEVASFACLHDDDVGIIEQVKLFREHWNLRDRCKEALDADVNTPRRRTWYMWIDFEERPIQQLQEKPGFTVVKNKNTVGKISVLFRVEIYM